MTRGTASPSHDQEHPTTGVPVVRPTFAQPSQGGLTSTPRFARILVILLALAFLVASLAFIIQLSNARKEPATAPGTPAIPAAGAAAANVDGDTALLPGQGESAITALVQASPSLVPSASPDPFASPAPFASIDPLASAGPDAILDPLASAGPGIATIDPAAIVELRMPFVPVVNFWSTKDSISKADLVDALKGGSGWDRVLIPAGDRAAIEGALGITIANRVEEADPATIENAIKARKAKNLGILRASDVTFRVHAMGIGDRLLFGNDRVQNLDNWPLTATVQGPAGSAWNQKGTWTLVAGGDSFTDRGIYERVVNRKKGIDYPFSGGTAKVTGHYCCGPFVTPGHPVPSYTLSGPRGIVRDMVKNADLAITNHESPIPNNWRFHLHGFIFSGKPALTEIFQRAGIDWMSLANNHMKDYGTDGIIDTRRNLDKYGIKYAGAGKNLKEASQYSILEVKGNRIAIIPCNAIGLAHTEASKSGGGVMPCRPKVIAQMIREAKSKADFVIVFPHWGVEYDRDPLLSQQKWAAKWAAAGADLILGAHSHVAGGIGEIDGMPVLYSMGNFIFDQNWATYTMESFLTEATFHGSELVQLHLHPYLTHDQAQPNFLDPATDDGKALMKAVRRASLMDW
jgi:hypothetical protein